MNGRANLGLDTESFDAPAEVVHLDLAVLERFEHFAIRLEVSQDVLASRALETALVTQISTGVVDIGLPPSDTSSHQGSIADTEKHRMDFGPHSRLQNQVRQEGGHGDEAVLAIP